MTNRPSPNARGSALLCRLRVLKLLIQGLQGEVASGQNVLHIAALDLADRALSDAGSFCDLHLSKPVGSDGGDEV